MRKPVFIAATLALAISIMGAGYAAWSETVTINNNMQTGNLRVEFVEKGLHPFITGFDNDFTQPDAIQTSLQHGAKVTTVSISNLYPGATALLETRIENLGDIPAIAVDADVIFDNLPSEAILDSIICRGQILQWRPNEFGVPVIVAAEGIPIEDGVPLRDLEPVLTAMVKDKVLLPGDFFTFDTEKDYADQLKLLKDFEAFDPEGNNSLFLTLPSSSGNESENLLNTQFQIKFNFKQYNM